MSELRRGAFGEPLFERAALDLEMPTLRRYLTYAPFADIAAFFEDALSGDRFIQQIHAQHKGEPTYTAAAGPRSDAGFACIVVVPNPRPKKDRPSWHILVTPRTG